MKPLNSQEALQILIYAVQAANLKGVYTLQESSRIATAVQLFTKKPEAPETPVDEKVDTQETK